MPNTVTFLSSVGGDNSTVTDDANVSTGLDGGGHRTRFVPALAQVVAVAAFTVAKALAAAASAASAAASAIVAANMAASYNSVSSTNLTVGLGTKSFAVAADLNLATGMFVLIADVSDPSRYMHGQVTSYDASTGAIEVLVGRIGAVFTGNNWRLSLSGPTGATGSGFVGGTMTGPVNFAVTSTVTAATAVDIAAAGSNEISLDGNETVVTWGTVAAGARRWLRVTAGSYPELSNSTSCILPTGQDIQCKPGDTFELVSLGSNVWACTSYQRADGAPLSFGQPKDLNTNQTLGSGDVVTAQGSSPLTFNLPATPKTGWWVVVRRPTGVGLVTLGRNGSTIAGLSEDLNLDLEGVEVRATYNGSTWTYTATGYVQ